MTVSLHSQVSGSKATAGASSENLPVILLHGLFGSLENLGVVARALSDNWQVHSLDLRNHGRSPHVDSMSYPEMAEDVRSYLDQNGIARAVLIGHSMGGKTAMQLALDAPDRVARLIVADIAPVDYPAHHDAILKGLNAVDTASLNSRSEADRALRPFIEEAPVRQFLLKNLTKTDQGGFTWRLNLDAIEKCYDGILAGQESGQAYQGPMLLIKGGQSDYIQDQHRDKIARLFPNTVLRIIPGTGHWLHAEKPALFTTLCERFLNGEMD